MLAIQGYKGHLARMASRAVNLLSNNSADFSPCQSKYDRPFALVL